MSISGFLAALPVIAVVITLTAAVVVLRWHDIRRAKREAAAARHPSRQALARRRKTPPGLPVDGEPLSDTDLAEYTQIMLRALDDTRNQAQETTSDEGAAE